MTTSWRRISMSSPSIKEECLDFQPFTIFSSMLHQIVKETASNIWKQSWKGSFCLQGMKETWKSSTRSCKDSSSEPFSEF